MQDSRLNYIEQHAERIGLDSDKLENLRVSASKASPMGDTLDLCARFADGKALDDMVSFSCCTHMIIISMSAASKLSSSQVTNMAIIWLNWRTSVYI